MNEKKIELSVQDLNEKFTTTAAANVGADETGNRKLGVSQSFASLANMSVKEMEKHQADDDESMRRYRADQLKQAKLK